MKRILPILLQFLLLACATTRIETEPGWENRVTTKDIQLLVFFYPSYTSGGSLSVEQQIEQIDLLERLVEQHLSEGLRTRGFNPRTDLRQMKEFDLLKDRYGPIVWSTIGTAKDLSRYKSDAYQIMKFRGEFSELIDRVSNSNYLVLCSSIGYVKNTSYTFQSGSSTRQFSAPVLAAGYGAFPCYRDVSVVDQQMKRLLTSGFGSASFAIDETEVSRSEGREEFKYRDLSLNEWAQKIADASLKKIAPVLK